MSILFDAFSRTPSFPQMVEDAIKQARHDKRFEQADIYRAIGDQLANLPR